ncbi:MAG: hypothetical protein J1F28_08085 [Oscillospiraceae bacterium]|nr:hypothetical protein [Oscillospiraceae bacterium]
MKSSTKNIVICIVFGIFFAAMFLCCLFLPKPEFSYSERRKLAQMPPITAETVMNGNAMTSFETYSTDNFPLRDTFRTLKAVTSAYAFRRLDNNKIYVADGYAAKIEYPMRESALDYAADRFRNVYNTLLAGKTDSIYISVIPDKGAFLAEKSGRLSMDYGQFESLMAAKTGDFADYITISDLLGLSDYYKTDTHWRQENIVDVAQRLASEMGTSVSDTHTVNELDHGFHGVYYGQSALPLPHETIYYLTNPVIDECKVYNGEKNNAEMGMYDMELAVGYDPYEMFLSGSLSMITIENPNADNGRHLVLFRDSFGSAIAPLLAEGYAKVTVVDIRYIQPFALGRFVDFENADVLFLYSSLVLNNSETIK